MVDSKDVSTKWAVLLGINAYPVHPLGGCVRDVSRIHNYLTSASTRVNVTALTASPADDSLSSAIIESPSSRPTYNNVVSKLDEIADKATSGDHVHIHFSGHGTRNKLTGDFNLVLLDDDQDIRYLGGHHLAGLLSKLVDKGLHVTLVLDCCFSGGILRQNDIHDPSVRTIEYDPGVDTRHPPAQLEAGRRTKSTLRDVTILPRWLIDPRCYTVLTACGPHEKAQEHTAEDGEKCGV
ncbi:caspase domain-containing protein [Boeremia exigua]|uniref:caspase domain-containing protein n=1 Tax=Boeremia exigua TaxID=749465 RepID=UPI001E8EC363|nr:caspase domain-containing protein [Boeremia exigua]KAH6616785.1 caspase domain-containing protein [Boeremia exigua]